MTASSCFQQKTRNAKIFGRLACLWLFLFMVSAVGPAATTSWLRDFAVPAALSAPDQPGEQVADTPQQFEAETEFSKEILFVAPVPCDMPHSVVSVWFTVLSLSDPISFLEYWRVPACPRPPPSFLSFLS